MCRARLKGRKVSQFQCSRPFQPRPKMRRTIVGRIPFLNPAGTCQEKQISFGYKFSSYCHDFAGLKSATRPTENNRRPDSVFESGGTCQEKQISFGYKFSSYCHDFAGLKSATRPTENNRRPDSVFESGGTCQEKQISFGYKFSIHCRDFAGLKSATRPA